MSTPLVTKVLLADDHPIVLHGLRGLLDAEADFRVVAEAADGAEAVELALERRRRPRDPRRLHAAYDRPAGRPASSATAGPSCGC